MSETPDLPAYLLRDHFGAINITSPLIPDDVKTEVRAVLDDLNRPDEHGAWTTGCEFDSKKRGEAVNVDVYDIGYDRTFVPRRGEPQLLAVVQVRQFSRHTARQHFPTIHKDYYLVGRNENGRPFAHPVHSSVRRGAQEAMTGELVARAQAWIFGVPVSRLSELRRQGDVALVPLKRAPSLNGHSQRLESFPHTVADSHQIISAERAALLPPSQGSKLVDTGLLLRHAKRQHRQVKSLGWAAVVVGRRAETWGFSRPTAD